MKEKMNKIPVFYACDDNFVKYTMAVSYTHLDVYKRQRLRCILPAVMQQRVFITIRHMKIIRLLLWICIGRISTVSYTHLDVYKRQYLMFDTEAIDNVERYETIKENRDMFTTLYGEKSVCLLYTSRCV